MTTAKPSLDQMIAGGKVSMPNEESSTLVDYDPQRLVSNGNGRIIENELAPVDFKVAEAARAQKGKDKRWAAQLAAEAELHQRWATAERAKGRPERELTFGNCVRETGVLINQATRH